MTSRRLLRRLRRHHDKIFRQAQGLRLSANHAEILASATNLNGPSAAMRSILRRPEGGLTIREMLLACIEEVVLQPSRGDFCLNGLQWRGTPGALDRTMSVGPYGVPYMIKARRRLIESVRNRSDGGRPEFVLTAVQFGGHDLVLFQDRDFDADIEVSGEKESLIRNGIFFGDPLFYLHSEFEAWETCCRKDASAPVISGAQKIVAETFKKETPRENLAVSEERGGGKTAGVISIGIQSWCLAKMKELNRDGLLKACMDQTSVLCEVKIRAESLVSETDLSDWERMIVARIAKLRSPERLRELCGDEAARIAADNCEALIADSEAASVR